jgi:hypothetical protein
MKAFLKWTTPGLILIALVLFCCGCPTWLFYEQQNPHLIHVANHSGQDLKFQGTYWWPPNPMPNDVASFCVYRPGTNEVSILTESGETWRYSTVVPKGHDFHKYIRLQVEPDGSIYLMSETERVDKAVNDLPPQPPGFPIKPKQ